MKWNKAIEKIRAALSDNKPVTIEYHKKNRTYESHVEPVMGLISYKIGANEHTDIETPDRAVNNVIWIIDNVTLD